MRPRPRTHASLSRQTSYGGEYYYHRMIDFNKILQNIYNARESSAAFGIRKQVFGVDSEPAPYQTLHLGSDGKVVVTTGPDIRNTCSGVAARPIRWIILILLFAA